MPLVSGRLEHVLAGPHHISGAFYKVRTQTWLLSPPHTPPTHSSHHGRVKQQEDSSSITSWRGDGEGAHSSPSIPPLPTPPCPAIKAGSIPFHPSSSSTLRPPPPLPPPLRPPLRAVTGEERHHLGPPLGLNLHALGFSPALSRR